MSAESAESSPTETFRFQAEVTQLLKLVINSLYSHKEVFLRELVSNAADAIDKLRFRAVTEPALVSDGAPLEIRLIPDKAAGTLTIEDNGVGMTRDELAKNLGTIAHSGTRAFLEQLSAKNADGRPSLIGQFGVGFYSAYLVAATVEVTSRAAGSDEAHKWTSDASDSFTIEPAERATRGTSIKLFLKEDQREFLETYRLRDLVRQYSDFVAHPIRLKQDDKDEFDTVNKANALWQRPKSEITDDQYNEFYKHLTHNHDTPLARVHFKVEGSQEFAGLLFIPSAKPFDMMTGGPDAPRKGIRLFVKRVFIMDNCEDILPAWLRFVQGVIDSDDLPLNVSRELLQDSAVVRAIKKQVVKRTLDLLDELAKDRPEDYAKFWNTFGTVLKEGLVNEYESREKVSNLVRFESTKGEGLVSLAQYVERMPEGQKDIYYAFGESVKALSDSPYLEALRKKSFEVLYMTDPVDEWAAEGIREFKGKKLVSAMRADLDLGEPSEEKKNEKDANEAAFKPLIDAMTAVLGKHVSSVRVSDRLTDSPACLVVPDGGTHAFMERLLREHGRAVPRAARIFEINPDHALIKSLRDMAAVSSDSAQLNEWIEVLHDQALITEGSRIEDPNRFARRLTDLLARAASHAAPAVPNS